MSTRSIIDMRRGHLRLVHSSERTYYLAVVRPEDEQHYFLRFLEGEISEKAELEFDELGVLGNIEDFLMWEDPDKEFVDNRMHFVCYSIPSSEEINVNDINIMPGGSLIKCPDELIYAVGACRKGDPSSIYVFRESGHIPETMERAEKTDMDDVLDIELGIDLLINKGILPSRKGIRTAAVVEIPHDDYMFVIGYGEIH